MYIILLAYNAEVPDVYLFIAIGLYIVETFEAHYSIGLF